MKKTVVQVLAVLWLAALLRLTVFRDGCFSHGLFSGRIEWDAFAYYAKLARIGYWRYFTYLFVGNLVWFVPVGVLTWLEAARPIRKLADKQCLSLQAGADKKADGKVPSLQAGADKRADGKVPSLQAGADKSADKQCLSLQAGADKKADGKVPSLQAGADKRADKQCLSLLWAALLGFLLSLGIETMQFILGSGVSELDDLILNTLGAVLGWGFAWIFHKMCKNMKSPIDKKPQDIDNRR